MMNLNRLVSSKTKSDILNALNFQLQSRSTFNTSVACLSRKNKAIDDKERLSKPRSQIKGVELLRNPSLFKVI